MDRLIAPQTQRKRKSPNFSELGMIIPSPGMREKSRKAGKRAWEVGSAPWNEQTESVKLGRRQTQLVVRFVGGVPVDRDGIFVRGQLYWIPKRPRIASTVVSGGEHA
ncbi:hypothetical protein CRG98_015611 [Punica granatum]|uniref:Uncharacterized protein n=1 Tax=Punica granatum TaxID=22663 RepID=A0A2I0K632_PUNGR|nr:hypothetical protein CRG98_015611 [Punica granatum]